ncbi:Dipeptide transport system permease protein DppB [Fundidesulfovibrio magnetotacticus]|uniref:Dipeptide transport system permease protein DppB n=1 Tax=Fundidesulfovibrio magnetotacticus TaxID=2730080 RepID=A0A6V8LUB5_9BACT|nr:ABC transporter permease [Fundidesulfovibrio magnetotacticus]GFK93227.1 Dipeptide transport system permease protein DppB [Fundidesulfovibrio magnetotacticus]
MFAFFVRRAGQAMLVMAIISLVCFAVQHKIGDPIRDLLGESVSETERQALRVKLGLADPLPQQYLRFVTNALRGDLGISYMFGKPALSVILQKFPATAELVFCAVLWVLALSLPLGIYAAIRPRSALTRVIMGASIVGVSIPVFLIAIIMIWIFAVFLGWLPSFGRGETVTVLGFWSTGLLTWDGLRHMVLPSISLASLTLPLFIRLIRSEMMEVLQSEYVKFAFAKGLPLWRIYLVHAFKNTLLPVITVGGVRIGTMLAFTILTETVFQWQGMGFIFLQAVERADTSLLVAYLVVVGLIFVVVNTVVDLVYGLVNPMVRVAGRK